VPAYRVLLLEQKYVTIQTVMARSRQQQQTNTHTHTIW